MYKNFFITVLLCLVSVATIAQQQIEFNFKTKKITGINNNKFNKGEFVNIIVTNYNPQLYKVSIDSKDSIVAQPNDTGYLGLLFNTDKFATILTGLVVGGGIEPKSEPNQNVPFSKPRSNNEPQNDNFYQIENINIEKEKKEKKEKEIDAILNNNIKTIIELQKTYTKLKGEIDDDILILNKEIANRNSYDYILKEPSELKQEVTSSIDKFVHYRKVSQTKKVEIFEEYTQFKFSEPLYKIDSSSQPLRIKHNFIDSAYKLVLSNYVNIDTSFSTDNLSKLYTKLIKITEHETKFTSLPIYITADTKIINLSVTPIESSTSLSTYKTSIALPQYQSKVYGVTTGIFLSGLKNLTYSNKRLTDSTYSLIEDGQGRIQTGVNTLAFVAKQTGKKADYVGLSFGAGISLESKPKPRILLGASYVTGEKNKFVISFGIVAGFVNELSAAFSTTAVYKDVAANYQKDVIRTSSFFSINYSFLNK